MNLPQLPLEVQRDVSLAPFSTLRAGGRAEYLVVARSSYALAEIAESAQRQGVRTTYLGWGSNILPSDDGVLGLVVLNRARKYGIGREGDVVADAGMGFQELFLKTAQRGLGGLEYAVGIPGTVGGALVSNAGAYRSSVSEFLQAVEIVEGGERRWVEPDFMEFSYRDSTLRRSDPPPIALVRVRLKLPIRDPKAIFDEAREYQRQRISKQPPPASAGSFFKNVTSHDFAAALPNLPEGLRKAGVVPAGFLIEQAGLRGLRQGGAMFGERHANFILNVGGARASEIRGLAEVAKDVVGAKFGVRLEEEVLYLGDWSRFKRSPGDG